MSPDDTRRLRSKRETRETLISLLILEDRDQNPLFHLPAFGIDTFPEARNFWAVERSIELLKFRKRRFRQMTKMRTVGNSVERFVARALVIRSCDRSLNHLWGDIYREMKVPSFRFLVTRFQLIYLASIRLWWEFDPFLIYVERKTHGVGVVAAHPGTRGAGWPRWWTCWKNWITPEWSLSRPRTRRVEKTVSEFIKLYPRGIP